MLSMGLAVDLITQWADDPTAIIDYQTRFSAMVPVEETTHSADPAQPFDNPNPGAQLEVTATIGDINEDTNVVRIDLTVTNPNDDNAPSTDSSPSNGATLNLMPRKLAGKTTPPRASVAPLLPGLLPQQRTNS